MPSEAGIADCRVSKCDRKTVPRSGTRNRKWMYIVCLDLCFSYVLITEKINVFVTIYTCVLVAVLASVLSYDAPNVLKLANNLSVYTVPEKNKMLDFRS